MTVFDRKSPAIWTREINSNSARHLNNVIDAKGSRNKLQQLPNRDDDFTNPNDHDRNLIQQTLAKVALANTLRVKIVNFGSENFGPQEIYGIINDELDELDDFLLDCLID
jgi:hypothetical protein